MKKKLIALMLITGISLFQISTFTNPTLAQSEEDNEVLTTTSDEEESVTTTSESVDTFDLSITTGVQSIFDKSLPINLKITSNIDSDRMQVRWQLPTGLKTKGSYTSSWTTINEGDVIDATTTVIAAKPGTYNLVAEVQAWEAEANYVDTVAISLTFNNDLEIQPQSEEYYKNKTSWFWAKVGMGIVAVTLIGIIGYLGFKAFQKWMDED